eukprot:6483277-Amphidinium_carterae.1
MEATSMKSAPTLAFPVSPRNEDGQDPSVNTRMSTSSLDSSWISRRRPLQSNKFQTARALESAGDSINSRPP